MQAKYPGFAYTGLCPRVPTGARLAFTYCQVAEEDHSHSGEKAKPYIFSCDIKTSELFHEKYCVAVIKSARREELYLHKWLGHKRRKS
jgi:hypothetical protein